MFLLTTFPKIFKNSNFLLKFSQKIFKHFPTICVYLPNARKINAWFVKFFEKYAKIMLFAIF